MMKRCFKMGLIWQGLTHDLSKYSVTEFRIGVKYYMGGVKSPNGKERLELGYSTAWLHHKGRNKHHLEYWTDYDVNHPEAGLVGCEMPAKYVAEMLADRLAACENYNKEAYTQADAYNYFMKNEKEQAIIHPKTRELLIKLLEMVRDEGEEATFRYVRENVL